MIKVLLTSSTRTQLISNLGTDVTCPTDITGERFYIEPTSFIEVIQGPDTPKKRREAFLDNQRKHLLKKQGKCPF